jgi:serine/threonine protein kinase
MAQIMELLGDIPPEVREGGRYSRELFDHSGALRYIKQLKPWSLSRVMREKYLLSADECDALCAFLEPMLQVDPQLRASAGEIVQHPWLEVEWEQEAIELERVVW